MLSSRHFERFHEVPLPRAAVWDVLANTDRVNRKIGLPSVTYGELRSEDGEMFRIANASLAGLKMKWREYPFTWEKEGRYSVIRVYDQGPIARLEGGIELQDGDKIECTRLRIFADITPRGTTGKVLVPLIANQFIEKTIQFCEETFPENGEAPQEVQAFKKSSANDKLLDRLIDELSKRRIELRYAHALRDYLRTAPDDEVAALRPYVWADHVGLQRDEALRTCLHAVKVGILNLSWSMMCPNCRVSKAQADTLSSVENQVHCDVCGISYGLSFDRYVELKFKVHPAIREATDNVYCISGPFTAPHVVLQTRICRGTTATLNVPANGEEMRLRVLRSNHVLELSGDAPEVEQLSLTRDGWSDGKTYITKANWPLNGSLTVENATGKHQFVVLERVDWDDSAATAAQVTALQEFRDLFSSEVLRPGRQVAVESVTLFFSDLSNSTEMYERIGDAPAYGHVGSHFDFILEHIAAHRGAVVKTMGDAVMAVFYRPEDALEASIQIQRHFRYFRETLAGMDNYESIGLKIGLHSGPSLVVNIGDHLDYFGRTVNIAARVVAQGMRGTIICTQAVWQNPAIYDIIENSNAHISHFSAELRGVEEIFELMRVTP